MSASRIAIEWGFSWALSVQCSAAIADLMSRGASLYDAASIVYSLAVTA